MAFMSESKPRVATTLWHQAFSQLLIERCPPSSEIRTEVQLSQYPSRVDLLLLRRIKQPPRDQDARILRGLWPLLSDTTLADFKSPSREFRAGELLRLFRYGLEYHEINVADVANRASMTLVLIVPRENKALRDELAMLGYALESVSPGYLRVRGGLMYTTYIVLLEKVADAEHDDFVGIFTKQRAIRDEQARHWMHQWLVGKVTMRDSENLEGYDEMLDKLLASIPPEKRLAGLSPDDIVDSLSEEQREALAALLVSKTRH